jgi:hypothetical protein
MKVKAVKNILLSSSNLLIALLLLLSVAAWRGQILGRPLTNDTSKHIVFNLELRECHRIFPEAANIKKINDFQFAIFDQSAKLLGYAFAYKGEQGYGGRVPLFTFTNEDDVIQGIVLGKHFESNEYLSEVVEKGILTKWNGISRSQVNHVTIDAVSGATITSQAIITGVQNSASGQQFTPPFKFATFDNLAALFLLTILTFACFFPKKIMKYRTVLQMLTVVVFGFWLGQFLSFVQIINWLSGGMNWQIHFILLLVLALSVGIPVIFGKAFYCTWVCPFGAAQELCGKVGGRKIQLPTKAAKVLKPLRERLFIVLLILLWTGFAFDVTLVEPFSAFSVTTVSYWMLGFASVFLIVSMFIPKAWCRFFCPTGFVLEWIRKTNKQSTVNNDQ